MNYFNSNVRIVCLFIFIKFHDSYGVPDICKNLENDEAGIEIYLARFINIFEELSSPNQYDGLVNSIVKECALNPSKLIIATEPAIKNLLKGQVELWCDQYMYIYELTSTTRNAAEWCNEERSCTDKLKDDGFIFENGVDNYAFLMQHSIGDVMHDDPINKHSEKLLFLTDIRGIGQDLINTLEDTDLTYTTKYSRYLLHQTDVDFPNLDSLFQWCDICKCDSILEVAGFTNRYKGGENYAILESKYGGKCDELTEGNVKYYCIYLLAAAARSHSTQRLFGTHKWCRLTMRNIKF